MWRALLDELSRDFSRLRFTDIKAIVNSLFQYSSIHKAPQRGGDLLESPAKVSLIDSFAHPVGLTYISILNSNESRTRKLKWSICLPEF